MEGVDWIYLAVVRDRWWAVLSMVMKLGHLANITISSKTLLHGVTWHDPAKIATEHDVTHSMYLNMWRSSKDVQNACSNVFCFQSRTFFQRFFRDYFHLHQSRTDTLQHGECWMQYWIVYVRSLARTESLVVLTVTRILDFCLTSSWRSPSVRTVTACLDALYMT